MAPAIRTGEVLPLSTSGPTCWQLAIVPENELPYTCSLGFGHSESPDALMTAKMISEDTEPLRQRGDSDAVVSNDTCPLSAQGRHANVMISVLHGHHTRVEI